MKHRLITTNQNRDNKRHSWKDPVELPKAIKDTTIGWKGYCFCFWDYSGALFIDSLEKEKTINSDYYCTLLGQMKENHKKTTSFGEKNMHLFARQCK